MTNDIVDQIRRHGSISFDVYMEAALYGADGFFSSGRGAGRSGSDFVTSVESGSLFGAMVAEALDREWDALGQPDPFVVIEAGAGNGRLAREVERSMPRCNRALRYVLVERSAALREAQRSMVPLDDPSVVLGPFGHGPDDDCDDVLVPIGGGGPRFAQLTELPAGRFDGVVFANELLDNLPFGIAQYDGSQWNEARVGLGGDGQLQFVYTAMSEPIEFRGAAVTGTRIPLDRSLSTWVEQASRCLNRGVLLLVDYLAPMEAIVARSPDWLRTYSAHRRGHNPLFSPGGCDITADVPLEYLQHAAQRSGLTMQAPIMQRDWLRSLGIEHRVRTANDLWNQRSHIGDLEAMKAKSVVNEAALLTDAAGLGSFMVARLTRSHPHRTS